MGFEKGAEGPIRNEQEAFRARHFDESNGCLMKLNAHVADHFPVRGANASKNSRNQWMKRVNDDLG